MKTSEIFRTLHDDILIVDRLWNEEYQAIGKEINKEKEAHKQKLKELEEKRAELTWDAFAAKNADKIKLSDEASKKMMAFFKSIDDDKVKRVISQFEQGIITLIELMQRFWNITAEVSFDAKAERFAETNW